MLLVHFFARRCILVPAAVAYQKFNIKILHSLYRKKELKLSIHLYSCKLKSNFYYSWGSL